MTAPSGHISPTESDRAAPEAPAASSQRPESDSPAARPSGVAGENSRDDNSEADAPAILVAESSPALLWTSACETSRSVNERRLVPAAWAAFTGRTAEALDGIGWLSAVHPEEQSRVAAAFERAAADQTTAEVAYRLRRFDGEWRLMLDRARPVIDDATGATLGYAGACFDLTARCAAKTMDSADRAAPAAESSAAIAPTSTDGAAAGPQAIGPILEAENRALKSQLGDLVEVCRRLRGTLDEARRAHGEKVSELERLRNSLPPADDAGINGGDVDEPVDASNISNNPSLSASTGGEPTASDLWRRLVESRSRRRAVRRIASDLLNGSFAQPLDAILSGRASWRVPTLSEEQADDLERCRSSIRAIRTLLRNIVELSGDETGEPILSAERIEVFNVRKLLEDAVTQAGHLPSGRTARRGPRFDVTISAPELARGAAEQLRLVMLYTLSHALGFSFGPRLNLDIQFDRQPGSEGWLRCVVRGGAWMSDVPDLSMIDGEPDDEDDQFEARGEQTCIARDAADSPLSAGGLGVASGLRVAQSLCERLDGEFEIDLGDDGRFEIRFSFPLVQIHNKGCKRRHARIPTETLNCNLGRVLNVSQGGVCIECSKLPPTEVEITFDPLDDDDDGSGGDRGGGANNGAGRPLALAAHVVWSRRAGYRSHHVGMRFLEVSEEDAARLSRLAILHSTRRVIETGEPGG